MGVFAAKPGMSVVSEQKSKSNNWKIILSNEIVNCAMSYHCINASRWICSISSIPVLQ